MKKSYKSILFLIGLLLCSVFAICIIYTAYYKLFGNPSIIEVNNKVSINYLSGKKFNIIEGDTMKISITNSDERPKYYMISFSNIKGSGTYQILFDNQVVSSGSFEDAKELTTDIISIDANETKEYEVSLKSANSGLKGSLRVNVQDDKVLSFADVIIKNNNIIDNEKLKEGDNSNEHNVLVKSKDDLGVSYYFHGNVDNNYVYFSGYYWRIVRINGDGTVRIILDGETDVISNYYSEDNKHFDFLNSNINAYLNNWLNDNLNDYLDYIASTKYCSDIKHDDDYTYDSYTRIMIDNIPILSCLGDSFASTIGLLTIDEVILAGAKSTLQNKDFYLYNESIKNAWYTMSASKGDKDSLNLFMVDSNGSIVTTVKGNLFRGVRPVINIIRDIMVEGKGTKDNPYVPYMN